MADKEKEAREYIAQAQKKTKGGLFSFMSG